MTRVLLRDGKAILPEAAFPGDLRRLPQDKKFPLFL